jgi:L-rhamnose-H+ transport protein
MSSVFALGILWGILAGLVNGIFLLPMRYTQKWAWENVWLFFTILSTGILPIVAAVVAVPHFIVVFRESPFSYFVPGIIAGGIWGIAQVMYGLGLGIVGIAIGSAVVACTSTIAGTLGPILAYAPSKLFSSASLVLLVAITLIVAGIYLYSKAGARKEKETAGKDLRKQVVSGSLRAGLTICLSTGALGTAFIYGGKSSAGLVEAAKTAGASSSYAFYIAYMVTFNAGMIPGLVYSVYKLTKNKTTQNFLSGEVFLWNFFLALLMALLWYGGILMYGMSSEKMGRLGPSIAFALFASGTVLFANLFGWLAGEWKGASRETIGGFVKGMALIVLAILIIAFGVSSAA